MATEVGSAAVTIIPSARGFAKSLKRDVAKEFAGSDLDKLVSDALGNRRPIRLPVAPVIDPSSVPDEVPTRPGRQPRLPVQLDPLVTAFQAEVRRQVADLSRTVNLEVPASADTAGLRTELAAEIAAVESQLTAEIPTEPAGRREYEAKLRALVAQASDRVKAHVKVEVDPGDGRNRIGAELVKGLSGALSQLSSGASTMAGIASSMVSSVAGLVSGLVGLAVAAAFAVPAVYLLGGALGSIPGIIAGASAAIATLAIGFMGISDAFKDTASSGGGAGANLAAQARQVAQATRGVESAQRSLARAQRDVVDAQLAVTRARKSEVERLKDLDRAVRGARLGEEEAVLRVKEAEQDLAKARASGKVDEIERADLAYRQTLLGLEDAKDATKDLAVEQAQAAKVGVEGSDQVQAALQRQRDAIEGVTAAQGQLLSAQEALRAANEKPASGGGGVVQDLVKLAPAAQKFVDSVKRLKPAFEELRLNVQQRLFAGLDVTVKRLATAWFPQLNKTLGKYADTFNGLLKRVGQSLSQKSFIDNMSAGAESARRALERIGIAVSGPLVDAFGRLSRAAGPFIEKLGDEIGGLIEDFSAWITKLDKSGELDKFFQRASEIFGDLVDMGKDVASIFGSVMTILFGEEDTTNTPWEAAKIGLDRIAAWFRDPENQKKIQDWIDKIKQAALDIAATAETVKGWVDKVQGWIDKIGGWKNALSTAWQEIKDKAREKWDEIITFFTDLPGRAATALSELPSKVREKFVEMAGQAGFVLGQAIGSWINLVTGMPGRAARAMAALPGQLAGVWRRARPVVESAVKALIGGAIWLLTELPGKATKAVGDTGRTLLKAGRALIDGLIQGIADKVPGLEGILNWVSDRIPDWKGPYDHDKVMLVPAGRAIMTGLVSGISDEVPTLRRQLGDVTDVVAGVSGDLAAASLTSGQLNSSTAPAPAGPVLTFGGDAPDSFMRWVRDNVRIYYGGSAQSALGS